MTARTMLLSDEEIKTCGVEHHRLRMVGGADFGAGARYARTLYEADRNRLLDEIERLKASLAQWEAFRKKNPFLSAWDGEDDPTIPLPEKHEEKGRG